jgi:hypothetical protein
VFISAVLAGVTPLLTSVTSPTSLVQYFRRNEPDLISVEVESLLPWTISGDEDVPDVFAKPPLQPGGKENDHYLPILRYQVTAVAQAKYQQGHSLPAEPSSSSNWSVAVGSNSRVTDTHTNRFLGDLAPDLAIVRDAALPVPATVAAVVELQVCILVREITRSLAGNSLCVHRMLAMQSLP